MFRRWFWEHPASAGETYWQHLRMALGFSAALIAAGAACFVHALVPALFQKTASGTVMRLHSTMSARQAGVQPPPDGARKRLSPLPPDPVSGA
jgi:Family of unknown function (DUF6356)